MEARQKPKASFEQLHTIEGDYRKRYDSRNQPDEAL
jgi:hypothetical protein